MLFGCTLLLGAIFPKTQARYENQTAIKGIFAPEDTAIRSNFLAEGGRTVLLEDWQVGQQNFRYLTICLIGSEKPVSGRLTYQSDSTLISISASDEELTLSNLENVADFTLNLEKKPTEQTLVTVRVSWVPNGQEEAPQIWADFVIKLIPETSQSEERPQGGAQTQAEMKLNCPQDFAWEERLVLSLTPPEGADSIVFSYEGDGFPENTIYTLPNGKTYALATAMPIAVPVQSQQQLWVAVDFSWVPQRQNGIFISAVAYRDGMEIAADNPVATPGREKLQVQAPSEGLILEAGGAIEIPISGYAEDVSWTLERLQRTGDTIAYMAVDTPAVALRTAEGTVLTISNDGGLAPAGTYRLSIQRKFCGVPTCTYEIPIFIQN